MRRTHNLQSVTCYRNLLVTLYALIWNYTHQPRKYYFTFPEFSGDDTVPTQSVTQRELRSKTVTLWAYVPRSLEMIWDNVVHYMLLYSSIKLLSNMLHCGLSLWCYMRLNWRWHISFIRCWRWQGMFCQNQPIHRTALTQWLVKKQHSPTFKLNSFHTLKCTSNFLLNHIALDEFYTANSTPFIIRSPLTPCPIHLQDYLVWPHFHKDRCL